MLLADLLANNTSAASSFAGIGTIPAPKNVSNLSIRSGLYPGATTKVAAHLLGWFWKKADGTNSSHLNNVNVGYVDGTAGTGYNATQLSAQLDDMVRRGVDEVVLDWYGPASQTTSPNSDSTAQGLAALCPGKGLGWSICIDQGAVSDVAAHEGVSLTSAFVICVDYVQAHYYGNSAYMKRSGRPVLFFFPPGNTGIYNWTTVRAELIAKGNPIFVSEGTSAYGIVDSSGRQVCSGAYAWVGATTATPSDPEALAYLNGFYNYYATRPSFHIWGSVRKGFNDDLSNGVLGDGIGNWGTGPVRSMTQADGNTWFDSFAVINSHFSSTNQLENIQIPTWDDYEEDSEIETGIATSLAFTGISIAGTALAWVVTGNTQVFDHYEIWGASDGINFALQGTSSGLTFALDTLPVGDWTLVVRAMGMTCVQNSLSATIEYNTIIPPPIVIPPIVVPVGTGVKQSQLAHHVQIQVSFPAEAVKNEILGLALKFDNN